jgi:hypothetical protein
LRPRLARAALSSGAQAVSRLVLWGLGSTRALQTLSDEVRVEQRTVLAPQPDAAAANNVGEPLVPVDQAPAPQAAADPAPPAPAAVRADAPPGPAAPAAASMAALPVPDFGQGYQSELARALQLVRELQLAPT